MSKTTLIACSAAVLALAAAAARPRMGPAIIASVDLERVFNECLWRGEAEHQLERQAQTHQAEADRLRAQVDLARQDMELLVPGTEQYRKAEQAYVQAAVDFRAYVEFSGVKLEGLRAESRKKIFERIVDAAGAYAVANSIGYIITNDSNADLQEGTDRQVVQQLLLRRVVYANPEYDITDDLIAWINNK